ncbi:universal stress protein [Synechococcus sp. CB0101]|uniref:universal stress protein n=1 Tax=Synechococcus sp. CB0101 TaxID=232348 RepID=UPI000200264B|nr:universal stress protein [Synechococcus sp. CB0101]QCH13692.1 universal stress protein [Synechococcus sp. CB0101]
MVRHLLVPIDGSELTDGAVHAALELAKQSGARVSFFHVQPSYYGRPDVAIYGEGLVLDPALSEQFSQANARFAATILDKALEQAQAAGVEASSETCVSPLVHEAILEAAERLGCDLIAMASHGRRGLAGLLIGSETQRVLTHAKLPVLVIPAQASQA